MTAPPTARRSDVCRQPLGFRPGETGVAATSDSVRASSPEILDTFMARLQKSEPTFSATREVVIGLSIYAIYMLVRKAVVTEAGEARALDNARAVVDVERRAGIHLEPEIQRAMLPYPRILNLMSVAYAALNVGLTVGWLARLFHKRDRRYPELRRATAYATLGALPFFLYFPCAPPRKLDHIVDTIADVSGIDLESPLLARFYIPIAAMPSIHVTYAVVTGLGMAQTSPSSAIRGLGRLYTPLVAFIVFATGNHYILDGVLGAAIGWITLRLARLSLRRAGAR